MWHKVTTLPLKNNAKEFGFEFSCATQIVSGFIVYSEELKRWFAYVNQCPHQGLPLNWQPHQFLDQEQAFLVCSMHLALFTIDKGECVHGVCLGQQLQPLQIKQEEQALWVACPDTLITP